MRTGGVPSAFAIGDTRPFRGRALAAYAVFGGVASAWDCPGEWGGRGHGEQ